MHANNNGLSLMLGSPVSKRIRNKASKGSAFNFLLLFKNPTSVRLTD